MLLRIYKKQLTSSQTTIIIKQNKPRSLLIVTKLPSLPIDDDLIWLPYRNRIKYPKIQIQKSRNSFCSTKPSKFQKLIGSPEMWWHIRLWCFGNFRWFYFRFFNKFEFNEFHIAREISWFGSIKDRIVDSVWCSLG